MLRELGQQLQRSGSTDIRRIVTIQELELHDSLREQEVLVPGVACSV